MSEFTSHSAPKVGSDAGFGWVFAIVFMLIGLWPWLDTHTFRLWALAVSASFMLITLAEPSLLKPLNQAWFKFGLALGAIVSPLAMGIVYFLVITPVGLLRQAFAADPLARRFEPTAKSYWIKRSDQDSSMEDQF